MHTEKWDSLNTFVPSKYFRPKPQPMCTDHRIGLSKSKHKNKTSVAGPEEVQGVRTNPPFRQNYFNFMEFFLKI